nr:PAS domain-containing protein [Anabaena sphaerica]
MDLETAIARHPLTIAPNACVVEAITLMSAGGTTCSYTCKIDAQLELLLAPSQSSCVLVLEDKRLVGIVTERDLVRLSATERNLSDLTIAEVMVSPVITLQASEFTNLFVPLSIFQQHHVRHLPLVDEQGKVLGLLTHDSLRQLLRPIDLLHLRVASEVMTPEVVHTQPTTTIVEVTQLLTANQVSSVVIVADDEHHPIPIGIITERDIVQFLALELDFATIQAQTVMSTPVFSVRGDISLWSVRMLMQERQINRLVVTDEKNRLLGIVTQTSLLNVLNPMEIYRMVETLEEKVSRLESEKLELLQARNTELERQVKQRTAALETQVQRERLLTQISTQIRSSLNLQEILSTAVTEVRGFLKCDRIIVYQFEPDWSGIVVAESLGEGWTASIAHRIEDPCFQKQAVELYGSGRTIAIDNIHKSGYAECHVQLLEQYQIKANLVVPILVSGQLWGLLIGHHCTDYRHWNATDLTLLEEIGIQLAIAIQQGTVYQAAQTQIAQRQKAEVALRDSEEKFRQFAENSHGVMLLRQVDSGELLYVNPAYEEIWGQSCQSLYQDSDSWMTVLHPDDQERIHAAHQATDGQGLFHQEYRIIQPDGSIRWIWGRCFPIKDSSGQVYRIAAMAEDITEQKQTELALRQSQSRLAEAQRVAKIGNWEFDIETGKITWSAELFRILGRDPSLGEPTYLENLQLYHPEDAEKLHQAVQWAIYQGEPYQLLLRAYQPDGSFRFMEAVARAELNNQGLVKRLFGTVQDVNERVQVERALAQLNQELEIKVEQRTAALQEMNTAMQNAVEGISRLDTQGRYLSVNPAYASLCGYEPQEMIGMMWELTFHPEDIASMEAAYQQMLKTGKVEAEARGIRKDGTIFYQQLTMISAYNEQGEFIGHHCFMKDVSERKQAELALKESQQFIQQIAEASPNILYLYDIQEQRNVYVNREIATILGYTPEEIQAMGSNFFQNVMHPDDLIQLPAQNARLNAIQDGEILEFEYRMQHANGEWRWLYSRDSVFKRDDRGKVKLTIGTAQDITERKQAELENQLLKERMQFILSSSPAIIYTCKPSGDFRATFISENIQSILGYTTAEFMEESGFWANHIHPEDKAGVFAKLPNLLEQGYHVYEYRFLHKNGHYLWMRDEQRVVRNYEGVIIEIVGYFADISDRKRLEQEQNRLIAILEASTDYIGITDASGKVLWNNREFRRLWNLDSNASVKDKHIPNYHPQWALKLVLEAGLPGAIANGTWVGETALLNAQGEEIPVSQLIIAHKSPQGEVEFFSTILRDIRTRKEYEQRLELSNAELTRATRLKDEFLANMSHELRTPLNAILGLSEGLQEEVFGILNERQKQSLSTIERSGRHLLELINDILDVSKIEAGKLELKMDSVSVIQLCNSSLSFVKQQAMQKSIQLRTAFQEDFGEIIVDERRMRQVLINLLNNAVKFTPSGGKVTLAVHLEHLEVCQADEGCPSGQPDFLYSLCFSVIDTGIGIAPADMDKLFQPFMQIESSLNRKYAGTGLGLTLVKQIVELHGAFISISSELGKGSCFTVRLPYIPKRTGIPTLSQFPTTIEQLGQTDITKFLNSTVTAEPVTKPPMILLAEDNLANIDALSSYLEARGYQLILANNGHQAIAKANSQTPDLILMDIQMPEMDGLEAMRQIRANPQLVSIPIIALTALAMPGDQEKCLQAGANEYLTKPVKLKQLAEMIQKLLKNNSSGV